MTLTPEQQQTVATWVAAGDSLSTIQNKLSEQFHVSMTYRDVRFLVDDLNLALKDPAPKVDASDLTKTAAPAAQPGRGAPAPEKKGFFDKAKEKLGLGKDEAEESSAPVEDAELAEEPFEDQPLPTGGANVSVTLDNVTLIPGAVASGSVTFSDGVTGKWLIDQYGRPGFTEVSQPGYRPKPDDAQAFMQELTRALQRRGY